MEVNLRKAHALQEQINELIHEDYDTETQVDIMLHDNYEAVLSHAQNMFFDELEDKRALILARKEIRQKLAFANYEHNVDALLTEMNMCDAEMSLIANSLSKRDIRKDEKVLWKQRTRMEEDRKKESGIRYGDESVNSGIVTKGSYDTYLKDQKRLKKQKQDCSDKLLAINISNKIELPTEVVELMRKHQLVD